MIEKAITGLQILCLLAVMVSGLAYLLTGRTPEMFVSMIWVIIGAAIMYAILGGVDRVLHA